jgi:hypothetical protein
MSVEAGSEILNTEALSKIMFLIEQFDMGNPGHQNLFNVNSEDMRNGGSG